MSGDEGILLTAPPVTPAAETATPQPNDGAAPADGAAPKNDAAAGDAGEKPAGAAADNKTDAGKPAEAADADANNNPDGKGDDADADEGVPESYSLTAPEGFDALDEGAVALFTPVAKELGLNNAKAQRLINDVYAPLLKQQVETAVKGAQEQVFENHRTQTLQWVETVKADKEIGGADYQQKVGLGTLALEKFGTPELREFLTESRLCAHPELVRFCYRVGKTIQEDDGLVHGTPKGQGSGKAKPAHERMGWKDSYEPSAS